MTLKFLKMSKAPHCNLNQSKEFKNPSILFWNVQGLSSKINEIFNYINKFDIVILAETWIEINNFTANEKKLPQNFTWIWTEARREKKKGRAKGGMLTGIRSEVDYRNAWNCAERCITKIEVNLQNEWWTIIGLYNRQGLARIKTEIEDLLEKGMTMKCIMIGDLNARCGNLGGIEQSLEGVRKPRHTKDSEINAEGKKWIDVMNDYGLTILNGNIDGDWRGEITHIDYKSQSVIDYGAANDSAREKISSFKIGRETLSDHFPLTIYFASKPQYVNLKPSQVVQNWSKIGKMLYQNRLNELTEEIDREAVDWDSLENAIWEATQKKTLRQKSGNYKEWWDNDCYKGRKAVQRALEDVRRGNSTWDCYRQKKKEYKSLIRAKKHQIELDYIEKLQHVKNMSEAWRFVNRERPKKKQPPKRPPAADTIEHFKKLLDAESEPIPGEYPMLPAPCDKYVHVSREEIDAAIQRLKLKKAAGTDRIKSEAFLYSNETVKEIIRDMVQECLMGRPIPEKWQQSILWTIHKKGSADNPENYRGISLLNSIYKIWANVLLARMEKAADKQNLLPDTQAGFRKGRSTIDNVYILNHCVQKYLSKSKKLFALFIDFKAAFDNVNRERLWKRLERIGIEKYLINALRNTYSLTALRVENETIYTTKGLKQGCPLSPLLFALYIGDFDDVLRKQQDGGIVIGKTKVFSLAYADDIVVLAESVNELRSMMATIEKYTKIRSLTVNCSKTKILRFSKGGRLSKEIWKWSETEVIEELKTFQYLGFFFQTSGKFAEHIRHLAAIGKRRSAETWSIGERKFPNNFKIRKQMYFSLVKSSMIYGVELTGWREWEELETIQRRHFKWILGLNRSTRNCVLMEECQIMPLKIDTAARAMKYEEKISSSSCELLKSCLGEIQSNSHPSSRWRKEREAYFNRTGWSAQSINVELLNEASVWASLKSRDVDCFRQLQEVAHASSSYRSLRTEGLPRYLATGRDIRTVARFRCGNEERGTDGWRKEEDRKCRVCGQEEETVEHLLDVCCPNDDFTTRRAVLAESGKGLNWMIWVISRRT